jgi:hypothetical protein
LKNLKRLRNVSSVLLALLCLCAPARSQADGGKNSLASIHSSGSGVRWVVSAPNEGTTLTVVAPDGQVFRREYKAGSDPYFALTDAQGAKLADGQYAYELRLTPVLADGVRKELAASREKGTSKEVARDLRKRGLLPSQPLVQSGTFSIVRGEAVVEGGPDDGRAAAPRRRAPANFADESAAGLRVRGGSVIPARAPRMEGLRLLRAAFRDQVIPDDLIVQGSACVGLDCVDGESFGFDTIRMKENNTRIKFEDTSTSSGFASNDWMLTANDSTAGGANKFSIEDVTGAKIPFTVTAGAPTNSVFVSSAGLLGLRTGAPVLDLHANNGDTPAFRMEQNTSGGFTAQVWDIGANEANFFVRDVTGGSRLPFRVRPGAPTSSIDISASGNVGLGTTSPLAKLHVTGKMVGDGDGVGNNAFADFGRLNVSGSGEIGIQLGRNNLTTGAAVIQAAKEGVGANTLTLQPDGGRVGIGTYTPDQSLSVNGNASKAAGGSWQTFSDGRLKNVKGSFRAGLKAVMQLQPLRYEYKADNALGLHAAGEHVGFVAQALQRVIPEAVTRNEAGYLLVNNDPVMWAMLNAIKEQQKQIEELKAEVRQLRARPAAGGRPRARRR